MRVQSQFIEDSPPSHEFKYDHRKGVAMRLDERRKPPRREDLARPPWKPGAPDNDAPVAVEHPEEEPHLSREEHLHGLWVTLGLDEEE